MITTSPEYASFVAARRSSNRMISAMRMVERAPARASSPNSIVPRSRNVPSSSVSAPWWRRRIPRLPSIWRCAPEPVAPRGERLLNVWLDGTSLRRGAPGAAPGGPAGIGEPEPERDPVDVLAVPSAPQGRRLLQGGAESVLGEPGDRPGREGVGHVVVEPLGELLPPAERLAPFRLGVREHPLEGGLEALAEELRRAPEALRGTPDLDDGGVEPARLAGALRAGVGAQLHGELHRDGPLLPPEPDLGLALVRALDRVPAHLGPADPADPDLRVHLEERVEVLRGEERRVRPRSLPVVADLPGPARGADDHVGLPVAPDQDVAVQEAAGADPVDQREPGPSADHAELAVHGHPSMAKIWAWGTPPSSPWPPSATNPSARATPTARSPSRFTWVAFWIAQTSSSRLTARSP